MSSLQTRAAAWHGSLPAAALQAMACGAALIDIPL
jgi:hypothetical protein